MFEKIKYIIGCVCMFGIVLNTHAQSIEEIKNSKAYKYGEGTGESMEEAEQQALARMSRSISVSIYDEKSEVDDGNSIVQKGILKAITSSRLRNVQTKVLSEEPKAHVFCYVHMSEVDKMFAQREERIKSLVAAGRQAEKRLQVDEAIRNYYWALVLAKTMPHEVSIELYEDKGSCMALLPPKIKSIFSLITIKTEDVQQDDGHTLGHLRFLYGGRNAATLQFSYFDGQVNMGPVVVRDGMAEIDLQPNTPTDHVKLRFETRFKNEAENLDPELRAAFEIKPLPIFPEANRSISLSGVKTKQEKGRRHKKDAEATAAVVSDAPAGSAVEVKPEPVIDRERIEMQAVDNVNDYMPSINKIEAAIRSGRANDAKDSFTPAGLEMFGTLLEKTGKVTLVGKSNYEFINANHQVIARFCKIKITFKNGRTFMENLVMRFNTQSKKVESIALALTKKAEDDIFNAAAKWPEVSRYTILNFMEDYQTAYALKRRDYLNQIFSENALIITGTVLTPTTPKVPHPSEGTPILLGDNKKIQYTKLTKQQFLKRLESHFSSREYIHLRFEDNTTHSINTQGQFKKGEVFGVQIKQIYDSPSYSDKGFLTLMLNMSGAYPSIEVRLWQPLEDTPVDLDKFFSNDNFKFN